MASEKRETITGLMRLDGGEPEPRQMDKPLERFRGLRLSYYTQNPPPRCPVWSTRCARTPGRPSAARRRGAAGRPAQYIIHGAMEQTGVQTVAGVLAAGDTINDLLAARNAGVPAAGALTGKLQRAELEEQPHDAVLEGVKDLPKYLASLDTVSV
ncbi:HAD hydrolase-like protein [Glutamicibacter creatinolyticus]|uniref:HAD hydrolase-like protein n=1 Tax=Glutamicibacter creatinolyticus TaxID=162496 RepID=UPI0037C14F12